MRSWVSGTARATFITAGFVALGVTVLPNAALADTTSGEHGVLSGNQLNLPISAPINVSGNGVNSISGSPGGSTVQNKGGQHTSGRDGVGSGNQVNAPISAPVNVCGNGVAVLGDALTGCEGGSKVANGGGGQQTSGSKSVLSGNQANAPISAPVDVCGNGVAVLGDALTGCEGGSKVANGGGGQQTSGSKSVLSGNQANAPISAPVDVCGNGVAVLGDALTGCEGGAKVGNGNGGYDGYGARAANGHEKLPVDPSNLLGGLTDTAGKLPVVGSGDAQKLVGNVTEPATRLVGGLPVNNGGIVPPGARTADVPPAGLPIVGGLTGKLPVQPGDVAGKLPVQPGDVARKLPVEPGRVVGQLPVQPGAVIGKLPVQPGDVTGKLPVQPGGVTGKLPVNTGRATAANARAAELPSGLPVQLGDVTNKLPVQLGDVTNNLPVKPGDVTSKLPVNVGDVTAKLPVNVGGVVGQRAATTGLPSGLPVQLGDVTNNLPVKPGDVTGKLPVNVGDVTNKLPVNLSGVSAQRTAAELPSGLPVQLGDVTGKLPVQPGGLTGNLPVQPGDITGKLPVQPGNVTGKLPVQPKNVLGKLPVSTDGVTKTLPLGRVHATDLKTVESLPVVGRQAGETVRTVTTTPLVDGVTVGGTVGDKLPTGGVVGGERSRVPAKHEVSLPADALKTVAADSPTGGANRNSMLVLVAAAFTAAAGMVGMTRGLRRR
ncbi:hypothetical protein BTM25_10310 [Actinomadura rubteroloni]|uniref:Chaplin domain-containing protein n=1 Tax=Actinomadura rubteroloni TaxID=1926885 RepID=A0A2P4UNK4_9ACTN|nr:chaplin [Actinomadura rubteroloni]POM26628.1 hypothetical protein BTM25_10310 [Actinomadura rubteroloni]